MRYSDFKIVEGKGEAMLAKVDMLLQNTGFARKGFEIVKAPQQGSIRGSITDEALDAIKATLAKAKAMGATEPAAVKPTMSKADITDKDFTESQSSKNGSGELPVGGGLESGPPYPQEDKEAVKQLQRTLIKLGYSVGSTGVDGKYGPRTTNAVRAFKKDNKIDGDGLSMSATELAKLEKAKPVKNPTDTGNKTITGRSGRRQVPTLSANQELQFPGNPKMQKMAEKARKRWASEPNTEWWVAALMAQIAHETSQMSISTERGKDSYFDRYDGRKDLGNVKPGDGRRYRGRGWIQLTGRYNYQKAGEALGIDLENNPEMAADPETAMDIAIWYFETRVMNRISNPTNIKGITKAVNGGYNGFDDRRKYFNIYAQALNTSGSGIA